MLDGRLSVREWVFARLRELLVILAGVAFIGFVALNIWAARERPKLRHGAALITALEGRLHKATTRADVEGWLREETFRELKLRDQGEETAVFSPPAGNAENWVLVLRFEGGRLRASRIGTVDSFEDHPHDAPPARTFVQ